MPYIKADRADELTWSPHASNKGELNYLITDMMVCYLIRKGVNYQNISDVIAAAQDAADEMKRRILAPYEDTKRTDPESIDPYKALDRES